MFGLVRSGRSAKICRSRAQMRLGKDLVTRDDIAYKPGFIFLLSIRAESDGVFSSEKR